MPFKQAPPVTGQRLIARYVYSGNPEIYPNAINLTTGVITVSGSLTAQGFTIGNYYNILFVMHSFANKILMKEINPVTDYYVYIASDTTLQLSTSNTSAGLISSYPDASNTAVDPTKWHFEYVAGGTQSVSIDISGFNLTDILFQMDIKGRDRGGYPYPRLTIDANEGNAIGFTGSTIIDGRETMSITFGYRWRYSPENKKLYGWTQHAVAIQWGNVTAGTWTYSNVSGSNQPQIFGDYTNAKFKHVDMTGIGVANGSVIEIYDMKGGY